MLRFLRNVVLLAGVVAMAGCNGCGPGPGGNDDRPPIIVSDGSVHLYVVSKDRRAGTDEKRGAWDDSSGKWVHTHSDNGPAKVMTVSVVHGMPKINTTCDNPEANYEVRSVVFTYGKKTAQGVETSTFRVFIDSPNENAAGQLTVETATAGAGSKDNKVPFWLNIGDPEHHLMSVTVGGFTCELEPGVGQVHIYQHIKK